MNDQFGREINYLRISLTDNCNLRCIYCTPNLIHKNNILSFEDISKIIGVVKELGIKKIIVEETSFLHIRNCVKKKLFLATS